MKFSKELIEKAKTAKTAEELLAMAKAENIELSAEEAEKAFSELHKSGEISDEELDNVAGGCEHTYHDACPACGNRSFSYYGDSLVHCSNPKCGQWYYNSKYKYMDE